jgi:hypothetical protein
MIGLRSLNVLIAAAAFAALSFSMPTLANDDPSPSATGISEVSSADVPLPTSRPAVIRKRIALRAPVRRALPRQAYRVVAPHQRVVAPYQRVVAPYPRVVAHAPMLMLGVGF